MKKITASIACLGAMLFTTTLAIAKEPVDGVTLKMPAQINARQDLHFLENKGQIVDQDGKRRTDIDYQLNAGGMQLFIGDGQLHYQWVSNSKVKSKNSKVGFANPENEVPELTNYYRMDVELVGANKQATVVASDKQDYYEHYYLPQVQGEAHSFKKITYKSVYPNIDWVIYINNGGLKYDFIVHPGGNPADIKLNMAGQIVCNLQRMAP